jgi:hypothetical protein
MTPTDRRILLTQLLDRQLRLRAELLENINAMSDTSNSVAEQEQVCVMARALGTMHDAAVELLRVVQDGGDSKEMEH